MSVYYRTSDATPEVSEVPATSDVTLQTPVIDYKIHLARAMFDIEITRKSFLKSRVSQPMCHTAYMNVLLSSGRKIHSTSGDGNCLFRAFSKELLSIEMHHSRIRIFLTDTVKWNAVNNASGIYFVKIVSNKYSDTRKMTLLK